MALALNDRVQQTGTANTTVSFTLTGSVTGYQSFAVIGDTNTTYYTATDATGNWEVGIGTYSTTGPTLTRTTILSSSNSGSAVTFSGTVNVWVDYPAEKAVSTDTLAYPPAIGGTTPSTGTFTTLTAQTETIKGTGQNFLLQSQTFDSASWPKSASFVTADQVVAPDGTTTADYFYATNPSATFPSLSQAFTCTTNQTYTFSLYVRSAERTTVDIQAYGNSTTYINETNVTGLTSAWTRITLTVNSSSYTSLQLRVLFSNSSVTWSGSQGIYIWGAQAELASTAGTYLVTTTTSTYGTPSLSFSGVAGLGLQSDGSLYVSPAGTGALQAQKTDSSSTGGNARGANAVDWQTLRASAGQVSSGAYSTLSGGYQNTSSAAYSSVTGGVGNTASATASAINGGYFNTNSGTYASVNGGASNTAAGYYNFIGAGFTNSGTSGSAVTTQSGTMNATTAVTLSGSNANIKVGQYITGTSIAGDTYVAAISGTSLTLSKNASGSSTSTLSFYTPHGVVVGGGNNQATGSYSFIGGGGDAGTAANRNVASGDWSTVGGGVKNVASGIGSVIAGGGTYGSTIGNTASGIGSFIGSGWGNQATNTGSSVVTGAYNLATGQYSGVFGGQIGTTRAINGYIVFPSSNAGGSNITGGAQGAILVLSRQTTDATATVLTSDSVAAGATNQIILPSNSAYYFRGEIIAGVTGAGNTAAWTIEGAIKRGSGVGTTAIVGTVTTNRTAYDSGASGWSIAVTADTTNGGLAITVTGQASTTIRWVAQVRTTEMTF